MPDPNDFPVFIGQYIVKLYDDAGDYLGKLKTVIKGKSVEGVAETTASNSRYRVSVANTIDALDSHTGEGAANYAGMIVMMCMIKNTPKGVKLIDAITAANEIDGGGQRAIAEALCNDHEDMAEDWWSGEYE